MPKYYYSKNKWKQLWCIWRKACYCATSTFWDDSCQILRLFHVSTKITVAIFRVNMYWVF